MVAMPYVTWDTAAKRAVYQRRYPKDVTILAGSKFLYKFPRTMSKKQADAVSHEKTTEFMAQVEWYRHRLATTEGFGEACRLHADRLRTIRQQAKAALRTAFARMDAQIKHNEDEITRNRLLTQLVELGIQVDLPPTSQPVADAAITIEAVIELWIAERIADPNMAPPKKKAIDAYRAAGERMFAHLGMPDDLRQLTKTALYRYREDLLKGLVASTDKRGRLPHPRRNLECISALCGVAVRVAMGRGITWENPAIGLPLPGKSDTTGNAFTLEERNAILVAARQAEPQIRWAHWLMAFSATILSELRYLTPANIVEKDGVWCVDIKPPPGLKLKTEWRPRCLPLHSAILAEGFLDYVDGVRREHGPNAPLFPMSEARFERAVNGLIAGLTVDGAPITLRSYAHRHFCATELEGFIVEDDKGRRLNVSEYVCGHAPGSVHKRNYVHIAVARLVKPIESLASPPAE